MSVAKTADLIVLMSEYHYTLWFIIAYKALMDDSRCYEIGRTEEIVGDRVGSSRDSVEFVKAGCRVQAKSSRRCHGQSPECCHDALAR